MRYKIATDDETVFPTLRRRTGETLQAFPGEVVELLVGDHDHDAALEEHLAADFPKLIETDEPADQWPRRIDAPEVDEEQLAVDKATVKRVTAAQRKADEKAAAQALLDAQALEEAAAAEKAAAEAAAQNS